MFLILSAQSPTSSASSMAGRLTSALTLQFNRMPAMCNRKCYLAECKHCGKTFAWGTQGFHRARQQRQLPRGTPDITCFLVVIVCRLDLSIASYRRVRNCCPQGAYRTCMCRTRTTSRSRSDPASALRCRRRRARRSLRLIDVTT